MDQATTHQHSRRTMLETLATYRSLATVTPADDAHGLDIRNPGLWQFGKAEVAYEAMPFAQLIKDIDAFFGDELTTALTGPQAAEAEAEVRRITSEHLAIITMRLAGTASAGSQMTWATASKDELQTLACAALQRAADIRFTEFVKPLVAEVQ